MSSAGLRRFEYSAETRVSPECVIAATIDFSERRPDLWPALTRRQYKVLEKGDTTALVQEGTAMLRVVEKYDWSEPGLVRWTVEESNFLRPGTSWELHASPRAGGGTRVDVTFERDYRGWRGIVPRTMLDIFGGERVLKRLLKRTLDILEHESLSAGPDAPMSEGAR
jgi:hypothetical protein